MSKTRRLELRIAFPLRETLTKSGYYPHVMLYFQQNFWAIVLAHLLHTLFLFFHCLISAIDFGLLDALRYLFYRFCGGNMTRQFKLHGDSVARSIRVIMPPPMFSFAPRNDKAKSSASVTISYQFSTHVTCNIYMMPRPF